MNRLYSGSLTIIFSLITLGAWAQCGTNTQSGAFCGRAPSGNSPGGIPYLYGTILPNAGCGTFNSVSGYGPGQYFQMPVLAGGCYSISTCGNSIDTQIGCFQGNATTNPFAYNDDNGPICTGAQASVNITPSFTDYTRVQVSQYNCLQGGSTSISVSVRQNNNLSITSAATAMCEGQTRTLTATPAPISGSLIVGSGNGGSFTGAGVSGTTFTAPTPSGASQTYTITYTFGYCTTTQDILVYRAPTTAAAGSDQNICGNSATLAGNAATVGTGVWTVVSGSAIFNNPNSPTSTVTITGVSATFRWTISNGSCTSSTDDVVINRDVTSPVINCPADINTNTAVGQCGTVVNYNVTATDACGATPVAVSAIGSGGFFPVGTTVESYQATDPSGNVANCSFNVNVSDFQLPAITCPADISVTSTTANCGATIAYTPPVGTDNCAVNTALSAGLPPGIFPVGTTSVTYTATDASLNQSSCSFDVTVDPIANGAISLSPSPICLGDQTTLTFTFTSGQAPFNVVVTDGVNTYNVNGISSGATFNVTPPTTVTYSYVSIQDASGCSRTSGFLGTAQVIVTPLPTVSFTGLNPIYCETNTVVTLTGNQNGGTFSGTGVTSLGGGLGQFDPALAGPTGPYSVTYTFTDLNNCTDADVQQVSVDEQPLANAGSGGDECDLNFTFSAVPTVGIGTWTMISGTGTPFFSNINSASSVVQVSSVGTYVFRWTEVNGQCSDFDEITVNFYQVPSPNPGFGGGECDLDFQLGASPSVGTGTWSASGPGNATYTPNANDPNAVVTVDTYGTYVLTWTENNGGCSNAASINVTFDQQAVSDAGSGGDECDLDFTFSAVPTIGSGLWTSAGPGLATFANASNPNTSVTVSNYGSYTFTWTETNGNCITSDQVSVNFYQQPVANAGQGGNECDFDFTFNAVASVGSGIWTYAGPGVATFTNATSPTSTVTVDAYGAYNFTWTETNGSCSSNASVLVNFYEQPASDAGTGGDECDLDFTFNGTASVGVGLWTATGPGTATFANDLDVNTDVTVSAYGTYNFTWTEIVGTCTSASSVTVNFYQQPVANAGTGGDECDLNFLVSATQSVGTGVWSQVSGPGTATFNNPNSPTSLVTVDLYGTYDFAWTETNGSCSDAATITVNFYQQPVANAGTGGNECDFDFMLSAVPSSGEGQWTAVGPSSVSFVDDFDPATTVTVSQPGAYTFTWTETNGVCSDADDVIVNFYDQPVADAGVGGDECDLNFAFTGVPSFGIGTWTYNGPGNAFFSNVNSASATVVVDTYGTYNFTWTEVNGICSDNATISVNFYEQPVADAGNGGSECDLDFDLNAVPSIGIGLWTYSSPGNATFSPDDTNPNATVTVDADGAYIFTWTEDNNGCADSDNISVVFNSLPAVSFSGLAAQYCIDQTTPVAMTGVPAGGTFSGLGISGNSFVPSIAGVGTILITYTYTDGNGCTNNETQSVDVNGLPNVSFSGLGQEYCSDDMSAYTLLGSPTGGTFVGSGISGSNFIPDNALIGVNTITYTYTDPFGCTSLDEQQVTINALPTVLFTGLASAYCADASNVALTGSPVGGTFSGTGIIGASFSPVAAGTGTHSITYTYTDGNGCTNSASQQVTINAIPVPAITPSGTSAICEGSNLVLNAGSGYSVYSWSNSTNGQTTTVTQAGTYNVTVTTAEGCSGTAPSIQVIVNQPPVVDLGNDTIICTASSVTLNAGNQGSTYVWSTQEISQSITVNSTGAYTVSVTDQNGCVGTDNIVVTVSNLLDPVIVADGPLQFCAGGSVGLNGGSGYDSYQWSTSEATQSISVNTPGVITLQVWDEFGCMGTDEVIVSTLQLPNAIISPSGTIALCAGDTATLSANGGLASYVWNPNGETDPVIEVWEAGIYAVTVEDPINGCLNTSASVEVVVNTTVPPIIVASGATEFCAGGSVTLSVEPGPYNSYLWCSGSTTPSITVTQTGDYCVTVLDANNCLDSTLVGTPLHVEVWNPQPIIEQQANLITVVNGPFAQFQWYFNGLPLPGQTASTITPEISGNYSVIGWDENGCFGTSGNIEFTFTGVMDSNLGYNIDIYPNPTRNRFTLEIDFGKQVAGTILLSDLTGRNILNPEEITGVSNVKRNFNLENLGAGIYYLRLVTNEGVVVRSIVKE
ncbi:MAG: HYR domain-containing protein [Flavobacteriales bacterium]|nr:HYR domain-containing protein [Flavobacteriales bacterium]